MFEKLWVQAPASTISSDGLGPLYNTRACSACHVNDGRGIVVGSDDHTGLVLRLSVPGEGMQPEPTYGVQQQTRAISDHQAEGTLGDGTIVTLFGSGRYTRAPLPRHHAAAQQPTRPEAVAFARRACRRAEH